MRTIKFRGYCEKDSEWRYGFYASDGHTHEILTPIKHDPDYALYASQVDPETIGEFTGMRDNNGKEIYEGDIVKVWHEECPEHKTTAVVKWLDCYFAGFDFYIPSNRTRSGYEHYNDEVCAFSCDEFRSEVIGNIHEDPEILREHHGITPREAGE